MKSNILSNLLNETYGLKLGEFNNTTETERVKISYSFSYSDLKASICVIFFSA